MERKRFILITPPCQSLVIKGHQCRNSKKRLRIRNWSRGHWEILLTGLFLVTCSACFLIAPKTTISGVAPPAVSCALPYQSSIKTLYRRLTHRPICWGHFLLWGSLFPNDYFLSRWHKTPSTIDILSTWYANTSLLNQNPSCCQQDVTNINITI